MNLRCSVFHSTAEPSKWILKATFLRANRGGHAAHGEKISLSADKKVRMRGRGAARCPRRPLSFQGITRLHSEWGQWLYFLATITNNLFVRTPPPGVKLFFCCRRRKNARSGAGGEESSRSWLCFPEGGGWGGAMPWEYLSHPGGVTCSAGDKGRGHTNLLGW